MQLSLAPTAAGQALGHRLEARRAASQQRNGAARLVVRASQAGGSPPSLDTSKGLFTSNSSLLGPKPNLSGPGSPSLGAPLSSSKAKQVNLDDVELKSGVRCCWADGCWVLALALNSGWLAGRRGMPRWHAQRGAACAH